MALNGVEILGPRIIDVVALVSLDHGPHARAGEDFVEHLRVRDDMYLLNTSGNGTDAGVHLRHHATGQDQLAMRVRFLHQTQEFFEIREAELPALAVFVWHADSTAAG